MGPSPSSTQADVHCKLGLALGFFRPLSAWDLQCPRFHNLSECPCPKPLQQHAVGGGGGVVEDPEVPAECMCKTDGGTADPVFELKVRVEQMEALVNELNTNVRKLTTTIGALNKATDVTVKLENDQKAAGARAKKTVDLTAPEVAQEKGNKKRKHAVIEGAQERHGD